MSASKILTGVFAAIILAALVVTYWPGGTPAEAPKDPLQIFDDQVEQQFSTLYAQHDGLDFFRNGGVYCDLPEYKPFDKPYVLPLLERLAKRFSLTWVVVTNPADQEYALSVYSRIPEGVTKVQLREALEEEQFANEFPGDILQQWGHKHISLDFLTPEQVAEQMAEDALLGE